MDEKDVQDYLDTSLNEWIEAGKVSVNVFHLFEGIQNFFKKISLVEVSIKQSQITCFFEKDIITRIDMKLLVDSIYDVFRDKSFQNCYFTSMNDNPILVIPDIELNESFVLDGESPFFVLSLILSIIADNICKCPALEIVVSENYIKCYLDKPGITVDDLVNYEAIFQMKGTLELHSQRPYLLFVNEP